jgi:hypothetical protein
MEFQGNAKKVTGGCFCGAVRYEADGLEEPVPGFGVLV